MIFWFEKKYMSPYEKNWYLFEYCSVQVTYHSVLFFFTVYISTYLVIYNSPIIGLLIFNLHIMLLILFYWWGYWRINSRFSWNASFCDFVNRKQKGTKQEDYGLIHSLNTKDLFNFSNAIIRIEQKWKK